MTRPRGSVCRQVIGRLAAAALLAGMAWMPTVSAPPLVRAAVCTGWSSTTTPPPTIRVLRSTGPSSGSVQTVDFKTYVKVVMAPEWSGTWPQEVMRAGAVAIKQYAWYYTMHYRGITGTGGCADVYDNNNDQIYQPETRTPTAQQIQAVDSTWPESILKNGAFILTGYRSGDPSMGCGQDADGYHLYQASASHCASGANMTGEQILHVYYGPGLVIQGVAPPGAPISVSAVPFDSSAQVSWAAPISDGGLAITAYVVTSTPEGKTCTTAGALTCAVGGLTNGTGYTFTATATNSVGTGPASDPSGSVTPGPISGATYVPLTPTRLLDSRSGTGLAGAFSSHVARTFQVTGGVVPAQATAVTGNLTVTQQTSAGFLYVGPVTQNNPTSSTLNFPLGDDRANAVTVALGAGGTLSVTYAAPTLGPSAHVIFDVTGYFTADTSGATYFPLTPTRLLDSRSNAGVTGP
ncbi:MAG: SpoIID/LytB domain-containing protein, partial [Candidatus Limnocylindrales bacterium]